MVVLVFPLDIKFLNLFQKHPPPQTTFNVSVQVVHKTHYNISTYLSNRLTIHHSRYRVKVKILVIDHAASK